MNESLEKEVVVVSDTPESIDFIGDMSMDRDTIMNLNLIGLLSDDEVAYIADKYGLAERPKRRESTMSREDVAKLAVELDRTMIQAQERISAALDNISKSPSMTVGWHESKKRS